MKLKSGTLMMLLMVFGVAGLLILVPGIQANTLYPHGAIITVTTTTDSISNDGLCTLREAVLSANSDQGIGGCAAGNGFDTILLGTGTYILTIPNVSVGQEEDASQTGDLDITDDLIIQGNGKTKTTVSANFIDRVFHVDPSEVGIDIEISNLKIQNGKAFIDDRKGGGGILTSGRLILNNVTISASEAQRGGGVRVTFLGNLTVEDSIIEGNTASNEGGGVYGDGPITLDMAEINKNKASRGGGIFCDQLCTLRDVTIRENEVLYGDGLGGGIYNDYRTFVNNVTITKNQANNQGGGVYSEARIWLTNVTISDNYSYIGGSGMYSAAPAQLTNVTIFGNSSLPGVWAGLTSELDGTLNLVNTIIANNTPNNCRGDFVSKGSNISSDNTCDFHLGSDLNDTDPLLDTLKDNGWRTQTHALLANSPAIDYGNEAACPENDQRMFDRPVDGDYDGLSRCDIGAYEFTHGGILRIQPVAYNVEEDAGSLQIAVTRSDGFVGKVSVFYSTWENTAQNMAIRDADYLHISGQLTWADGDSSTKYIPVSIVDDLYSEPDEIFNVFISHPTGGAGVAEENRVGLITILENDPGGPSAPPVSKPRIIFFPKLHDD